MNTPRWHRAITLIVVTTFLASGCATLQPVHLARSAQGIERPDVKVGESVVVKTTQGDTKKFTVTAVENDALDGKDVRVPYADIASLEVRRAGEHQMKPGVVIGVIAAVAALALVLGGSGGSGGSGY
jgi:hypothetical protein